MTTQPGDPLAVVRAIAANPEALAELQRLVMSAELGRLVSSVDALAAAQGRTEERLEQLAARVDALAAAQERTEARVDALAQKLGELVSQVDALARQMSALTGVVGNVRGELLEMRFDRRGHAYFAPIAHRLRRIELRELDQILDAALTAGTLTPDEVDDVRLADLFFRGRRRTDGTDVVLVVETSGVVDESDVRRASLRADAMRRAGHEAIAVVAGQAVSDSASDLAPRIGVWRVTDGHVEPPHAAGSASATA